MRRLVFALVALTVLACAIGVVVSSRDRFTTQLSPKGVMLMDERCHVFPSDSDEGPEGGGVPLTSFDGLQRRASLAEGTCVIVPGAGDGFMDVGLTACARGSAVDVDPGVVRSIGVQMVDGAETCVVTLTPGLPASRYHQYSSSLLDAATMQSELYKGAVEAMRNEAAILGGLATCTADLEAATRDYADTAAKLVSEKRRVVENTADAAGKKKLADSAALEIQRLEGMLATCQHVAPDHKLAERDGAAVNMYPDGTFKGLASGTLAVNLPDFLITPSLQKGVTYAVTKGSLPQGVSMSPKGVVKVGA
jgi:hypothetical protein